MKEKARYCSPFLKQIGAGSGEYKVSNWLEKKRAIMCTSLLGCLHNSVLYCWFKVVRPTCTQQSQVWRHLFDMQSNSNLS